MLNCHDFPLIEQISGRVASDSLNDGFAFGRSNNLNNGTWLKYLDSFSNQTGAPFGANNGVLLRVSTDKSQAGITTFTIFWHLGSLASVTPLVTLTTGNNTIQTFETSDIETANGGNPVLIPKDVQLAVQKVGGSAKDFNVLVQAGGTT